MYKRQRLYRLISISLAATAITGGLTWLILTPFARVLVQILYGHTEAVPIVIMLEMCIRDRPWSPSVVNKEI